MRGGGNLFDELKRRNVFRVGIAYVVVGWLLVQITALAVPAFGMPPWVNTVVFYFVLLGFSVALLLAWAFELTPEGIKRSHQVDPATSVTPSTGRKLDFLIIGALVLGLGYFVWESRFEDAPDDSGEAAVANTSIAVLPFVNMSDDASNEYFADGISEEILNVLSQIPGLHVTSRSSAFQFRGNDIHIPTVARQLGVANILEGSVRKSGTRVRITAQLIDAATDRHLWSASYDRELTDIFAIQDEISAAIVAALKEALGLELASPEARLATANTEAHEAYLRGRHLVVQRTRATVEGAVREFEGAIKLDPDYALAHAELAIAYLLSVQTQHGVLTVTEAVARAAPHAARAMALDPALAEAHAATGFVLWDEGKLDEALTHFRHATGINPNYAIVYNWMHNMQGLEMGRYDGAFLALEMSLRLDPLSIPAIWNYTVSLISRNRLNEAGREIEKLASIAPNSYVILSGARTSLGGKWANAVLANLEALRTQPDRGLTRIFLTWELAAIGLEKEALVIFEMPLPGVLGMLDRHRDAITTAEARLAGEPDSLPAKHDLGLALAGAGDYDRARPILEEMWRTSGGQVTRIGPFRSMSAVALVAILGTDAGGNLVGELLTAMQEDVRLLRQAGITVTPWFGGADHWGSPDYEEGLAAFLAGEREKGLALIAKAAEDGFFISTNQAYLAELYADPGFAPIRAGQEARQARERDKVLAVVCADNPYAAVWQPAEGTCKGYGVSNRE